MDFYKGTIPILEADEQPTALSHPKGATFGCVPRDYSVDPPTMFASPSQMQLVPASEEDARFDEQEETKSSLEHLYLSGPNGQPAFVNLDQNGDGYCWAYSTGHAIMLDRLKQGLPIVRLNPHATAAIIKKGRDEGGWCGLSAQFAREHGYAVEGSAPGQWPLHSRSLVYDTPTLRTRMEMHKVTEDWVDLSQAVYDQNLTQAQLDTCLWNNIPCPTDFYWWGHSVCTIRKVRIEPGSWGRLILNSWKGWGRFGLAVLRGSQAVPNGALAIRVTTASVE
jgi:hypothetical protein